MNTTELFAEQVLIGVLVMLMAGLVFLTPLLDFYHQHVGSKDYLEQLVAGGFILGAAYLIGMVYDRVVDTLLQDLESHCRLQFALRDFTSEGSLDRDPFEDGKYRILVLANAQATDHMEYLRSRIRLTRAFATTLPGIILSLLLAMDYGRASSWWTVVALTLPVVYTAVLCLKIFQRKKLFARPPKTYQLDKVRDYLDRARLGRGNSQRPLHVFSLLLRDEVWLGLLVLTLAGVILILSTRSYDRFWILLAGLVLTLIVGWAWWRISITFYAFLRNYQEHSHRS